MIIPDSTQLARQIAILSHLHPDLTLGDIARDLGYSALFIINALDVGEARDMFKADREKDTIEVLDNPESRLFEHSPYSLGESNFRIQEAIAEGVENQNKQRQDDIEVGLLHYSWLNGVNPAQIEIAIEVLVQSGYIAQYEIADPKDKESVYKFLTLPDNLDKQWGRKQFKSMKAEAEKGGDSGKPTTDQDS